MKTFYHLTAPVWAERIIREGRILKTESNIGSPIPFHSPFGSHFGPDVVWLLDELPTDGAGFMRTDMPHGLTEVKMGYVFEVQVPAIKWTDWEWTAKMDPEWKQIMLRAAGGEEAADHWHVFPANIGSSRFVRHYSRNGK